MYSRGRALHSESTVQQNAAALNELNVYFNWSIYDFLTEAQLQRIKGYFGSTSLNMMVVQQFVFKTKSPFVKQLRPV